MSKPIDQKLLPCPFCNSSVMPGQKYCQCSNSACPAFHIKTTPSQWNMRGQQPAGVAVPEGWKLVPIEPTTDMVNAFKDRVAVTSRGGLLNTGHALTAAINAAPHPVSGERAERPDALRKRFSDIEDEIMAGKHNAASVFTAMRTAALYIGQPAAQDVAGLDAAWLSAEIERICEEKHLRDTDCDAGTAIFEISEGLTASVTARPAVQDVAGLVAG